MQNTVKAQKKQKLYHDKKARATSFRVGDRVFVHMPALKTGPAHKLARPFKGPYRVLATYPNGAEVVPVDRPRAAPIRIAFNRLRQCPEDIPEPGEEQSVLEQVVEPGPTDNVQGDETPGSGAEDEEPEVQGLSDAADDPPPDEDESVVQQQRGGTVWGKRLRPRQHSSRTS